MVLAEATKAMIKNKASSKPIPRANHLPSSSSEYCTMVLSGNLEPKNCGTMQFSSLRGLAIVDWKVMNTCRKQAIVKESM